MKNFTDMSELECLQHIAVGAIVSASALVIICGVMFWRLLREIDADSHGSWVGRFRGWMKYRRAMRQERGRKREVRIEAQRLQDKVP